MKIVQLAMSYKFVCESQKNPLGRYFSKQRAFCCHLRIKYSGVKASEIYVTLSKMLCKE